jgi:aminoglycoside phosphotransferase (APT) family kinase protein
MSTRFAMVSMSTTACTVRPRTSKAARVPSGVVRDLPGYVLEGRAERGESGEGAWYATDRNGRPVVVKWFDDLDARERFETTAGALDVLRSRGYPVPAYVAIEEVGGVLVLAQSRLDGRTDVPVTERTVADVLRLNDLQADVAAPRPHESWGAFMIHTLTVGEDGWCMHAPLHAHSARTRRLVERAEAIGADADPAWFPDTGIIHLDLHPGNVLAGDDGSIVGVVDWEGACAGDPRFDLTSFAFCAEVGGGAPAALIEPVWRVLEATVDERVLRAYAVHQAIRLVDWTLRHHSAAEAERWLDAGEALADRYS